MDSSPPLFTKFVDDSRFGLLQLVECSLVDILRVILENVKKSFLVATLNFLEHLFTLMIQIFSNIEVLTIFGEVAFFILFVFLFFVLLNLVHLHPLHAEDVVEIPGIDAHIFVLVVGLLLLEELDINLHSFPNAVV